LAFVLRRDVVQERKLSRAAVETLAIIAYHQPATRAEIEGVRGVAVSRGTIDLLLEAGWIRLRGRRRTPGRPVTFGTTPTFLDHFGLESIGDLPGLADLKAAGLIESLAVPGDELPPPNDSPDLAPDEDPLEPDFDEYGATEHSEEGEEEPEAEPEPQAEEAEASDPRDD
jgi:segregation and condensation protein B